WEEMIENARRMNEKLRREIDNLRSSAKPSLVAQSKEMQHVLDRVDVLAQAESNIVILGESGTGKDLMARYIHEKSNRKSEAFVSVNCAAIPDNLLESELFGYEAGAFTGALAKGKIGLFEAATGGTLFLDEIGEMPLSLQSKLLRAIENKEIRRVGGIKNIPIDVRIICATNSNLENMVEEKHFREDLYYRLSVFTVKIPPLRSRKDDILPLAQSFLKELNTKYGTEKYFSPHCKETMLVHRWPGNIRELKNVVERIYVVSEGNALTFSVEPYAVAKDGEHGNVGFLALEDYDNLKEFLAGAEKIFIENVMEACGGAMGKAASRLGIHRTQLYRKLKKMEEEKH
nr:sigma 54-interacting transcriptional regulator [Clostridia bacterium]